MVCIECQRLVLKGQNCDKCGKPLPGYGTLPKGVCDKTSRLKEKTLYLRSGDITKAEFLQFLDQQEDLAWETLDETQDDKFEADSLADMSDELQTGRRSIATYLKALEILREWVQNGRSDLLQTAIAMSSKADLLMDETLNLNWQTYKNYMESTREFLIQQGVRPGD